MDKICFICSKQGEESGLTIQTKEGTVSGDEKMLENQKKAIRMLEGMEQPGLYTKRVGNFSDEMIQTMLSKMVCQSCQLVPSPYIRYICRSGHLFCESCAEERFVNHEAKCMAGMQKGEEDFVLDAPKKRDSSSILPIPPTLIPNYWMEDKKAEHLDVCQETLCRYPADPIFTAFWAGAQWKCPVGCGKVFEGRKLLTHVNCCERKTKPGSNYASESSGSDYTDESSGSSEENAPVLYRNVPEENDFSANCELMGLKQLVRCNVAGCLQQITMKDVVEHLILIHHVDAMDAIDDQRSWRATGWLDIPQSEIEARRPFYTLIRCYHRFFLFCMEPATENSSDVGFWIRRLSNMDNKEEENGPYFKYDFVIMDAQGDTQICYKKPCTSWRKSTEEVFSEKQCFKVPVSYVLDQFLHKCVDGWMDVDSINSNRDREKKNFYMKLSIMVANPVGELYFDEGREAITSSMESLVIVDDDFYDIGITRDEVTEDTDEDEE